MIIVIALHILCGISRRVITILRLFKLQYKYWICSLSTKKINIWLNLQYEYQQEEHMTESVVWVPKRKTYDWLFSVSTKKKHMTESAVWVPERRTYYWICSMSTKKKNLTESAVSVPNRNTWLTLQYQYQKENSDWLTSWLCFPLLGLNSQLTGHCSASWVQSRTWWLGLQFRFCQPSGDAETEFQSFSRTMRLLLDCILPELSTILQSASFLLPIFQQPSSCFVIFII